MAVFDFAVGDTVQMKKAHPCGSDLWEILRTGADVKTRCLGCGHVVMMSSGDINKRIKKVIKNED